MLSRLVIAILAWGGAAFGQVIELQPSTSPSQVYWHSDVAVTAVRGIPANLTASQLTARIKRNLLDPNSEVMLAPVTSMTTIGTRKTLHFQFPFQPTYPTPYGIEIISNDGSNLITGLPAKTVALPTPSIEMVWQPYGIPGTTVDVAIKGSFTTFPANASTITLDFGPGISAAAKTCPSGITATQVCATLTIAPAAAVGLRTVSATYGTVTASLANGFAVTVSQPRPLRTDNTNRFTQYSYAAVNFRLPGAAMTAGAATNLQCRFSGGMSFNIGPATTIGETFKAVFIPSNYVAAGPKDGFCYLDGTIYVATGVIEVLQELSSFNSILPAKVSQGSTQAVRIDATGGNFLQNLTTVSMGSGITVNSVDVVTTVDVSETDSLVAYITVAPNAALGIRTVTVSTLGKVLQAVSFEVTAGVPGVCGVTPKSALAGTTLTVNIQMCFAAPVAPAQVTLGNGISVGRTVVSGNSILTALTIDAGATPGTRNGSVSFGSESYKFSFTVLPAGPAIVSTCWEPGCISPVRPTNFEPFTLRIIGSNTNFQQGVTQVNANSSAGRLAYLAQQTLVLSPTELLATFPYGINVYSDATLVVTNATAGTELDVDFALLPSSVLSVEGYFKQGATSNVGFRLLNLNTNHPNVLPPTCPAFLAPSGVPAGVTCLHYIPQTDNLYAAAELTIDPLAYPGARLTEPINDTFGTFWVFPGPAAVQSIAANAGLPGYAVDVTITGSQTHWCDVSGRFASCPNPSVFSLTGVGGTLPLSNIIVKSYTQATARVTIPAGTPESSYNVVVKTAGESASLINGFQVVTKLPTLSSVSPPQGQQQQTLNVDLTFADLPSPMTATSVVAVDFGNDVAVNSVTVLNGTTARANITIGPFATMTARTVNATVDGVAVGSTILFTVLKGPAVLQSVSPNSGQQGFQVTLTMTGANTHFIQGSTAIGIGGGMTVQQITVTSPTTLVAQIAIPLSTPPGPYGINVITLSEQAIGTNVFTVVATQPQLLSITPTAGAQQQSVPVTIQGQFTQFTMNSAVSLGAGISAVVTSATASTLQATLNISPTAAKGVRTLTVDGATLANAFTAGSGPAAISGVSPAYSSGGTSLTVQVTGSQTNFQQGVTTANFGAGISVTNVAVVNAGLANVDIAVSGGASLGFRSPVLSTGGEDATLANGFEVRAGLPVISNISPASVQAGQLVSNIVVTGSNFTGATFSVAGTQILPATPPDLPVLVGGSVTQVSNVTGTSATLQIQFGTATGAYALVATTSAGASTSTLTPNNQLVVYQGTGYAVAQAATVVGSQPTVLDPPLHTVRYASAETATVVNGASTSLDPPGHVVRYASSAPATVVNSASLSVGSIRYASAWPANVLNQSSPGSTKPAVTNSSATTGRRSNGAGGMQDEIAYAGQDLHVQVEVPGGVRTLGVNLYVNGLKLADPLLAPYETVLTVPAGVQDLAIKAVVLTDAGEVAAPLRQVRILAAGAGDKLAVAVQDATGGEVPNANVALRYFGLAAEHFRFDRPLAQMPEIAADRKADAAGFAALLNYLPLGYDPLGTGAERDTVSRYRGALQPRETGEYEFRIRASTGAQLKLGGKALQEGDRLTLEAGVPVEVEVLHYRGIDSAPFLVMEWRQTGANRVFEAIRPEFLRTPEISSLNAVPDAVSRFDAVATTPQGDGQALAVNAGSKSIVIRISTEGRRRPGTSQKIHQQEEE